MAGTVTSDAQVVDNCDAVGSWTGSPTLDTEVYIEGTGSLSAKVSKTVATFMYPITSTDLSDTVIVVWVLGSSVAQFDTKANGGIRIRVENGITPDYTEWYVAGSDEGYSGGWAPLSVRTTQTPDGVSASPDLTVANGVGVVFGVTGSAAKINCWFDNVIYGTTVTVYAGTSGDPATFADIITQEDTSKWGFFTESEGVLFAQCKLKIGSISAGVDTYFEDTGKILVFRDKPFGTFYDITFQGNATGDTQIYWGTLAGGRGVSGITVKSAGTATATLTATDVNVDNLGLYGCSFVDLGAIVLPAYSTQKEVLSCNFEGCSQVDPDDGTVTYCNFIASSATATGAVLLDQTDHRVTYCNFINNTYAVQISAAATYAMSNLVFSGNTTDVNNSSAATQVDTYDEANKDGDVDLYSGSVVRAAQSFVATAGDLSRAIFYLQKVGAPTGTVVAKLYSDATGPDTVLATSETVATADISTGAFALYGFEFEDEYTLVVSTTYWISVEYGGGDSSNRIEVGYDDSTPGHSGACETYVSAWSSQTYDLAFYVNRDGIVTINATDSDPGTAEESNATAGATIIVNTVSITITVKDQGNAVIQEAQTAVYKTSDNTELMNEDTTALGVATADYNYTGDTPVYVRVRKSSTGGTRYYPVSTTGIIESGGFTLTVVMAQDQIVV